MDKLEQELEMRLDRIKVLMDATCLTIDELLASAAEKQVSNCETCPLLRTCDKYDDDGCYIVWLKFLEDGRMEGRSE